MAAYAGDEAIMINARRARRSGGSTPSKEEYGPQHKALQSGTSFLVGWSPSPPSNYGVDLTDLRPKVVYTLRGQNPVAGGRKDRRRISWPPYLSPFKLTCTLISHRLSLDNSNSYDSLNLCMQIVNNYSINCRPHHFVYRNGIMLELWRRSSKITTPVVPESLN
ncbi:hypothetical protein Fot_03494 [Forsythia ovata]|uniref:Uncharacterized protein n=1 Tax=Forsythia ovata TaxID=205694 RepID=A0ABD1XDV4_9LAMI